MPQFPSARGRSCCARYATAWLLALAAAGCSSPSSADIEAMHRQARAKPAIAEAELENGGPLTEAQKAAMTAEVAAADAKAEQEARDAARRLLMAGMFNRGLDAMWRTPPDAQGIAHDVAFRLHDDRFVVEARSEAGQQRFAMSPYRITEVIGPNAIVIQRGVGRVTLKRQRCGDALPERADSDCLLLVDAHGVVEAIHYRLRDLTDAEIASQRTAVLQVLQDIAQHGEARTFRQ